MTQVNVLVRDNKSAKGIATISTHTARIDLIHLRTLKMATGVLTAGLTNTMAFAWQNPEVGEIIVVEVLIEITTVSTAAAVLDVETAIDNVADPGTNTIFDALPLQTADVIFSSHNVSDTGGTGNEKPRVLTSAAGALSWITGWEGGGGSMADLVANYYIYYTEVS